MKQEASNTRNNLKSKGTYAQQSNYSWSATVRAELTPILLLLPANAGY